MDRKDLRIVFMGTPEFAVATLEALVSSGCNVVAVVTQPDRPVGRHQTLTPPAVKVAAERLGLPVLQPEKMRDEAFINTLASYEADVQVVVAFRMLPEVVWAMPRYGTFNVHASLLPQYRGAAPINWAIINGERLTGVTTFFLDHDIDTGKIILQKEYAIAEEADAGTVHDGLMALGAQAALDTIDAIAAADGHTQSVPQTDSGELHAAPKLFKPVCEIGWGKSASAVQNFIRGLSPSPGSWTTLVATDGSRVEMKIYRVRIVDEKGKPGTIIECGRRLIVACGEGAVEVLEMQLAGKRRMTASAWLNGVKDITSFHME